MLEDLIELSVSPYTRVRRYVNDLFTLLACEILNLGEQTRPSSTA